MEDLAGRPSECPGMEELMSPNELPESDLASRGHVFAAKYIVFREMARAGKVSANLSVANRRFLTIFNNGQNRVNPGILQSAWMDAIMWAGSRFREYFSSDLPSAPKGSSRRRLGVPYRPVWGEAQDGRDVLGRFVKKGPDEEDPMQVTIREVLEELGLTLEK